MCVVLYDMMFLVAENGAATLPAFPTSARQHAVSSSCSCCWLLLHITCFCTQQHICHSALYAIACPSICLSVCLSVCLSACHTGGSVKNGWS